MSTHPYDKWVEGSEPLDEGPRGKVYEKNKMFFRVAAGEATSKEGVTYELTTSVRDGSPMVRSGKSGRTFHLPWPEIVDMALAAGLDAPTEAHGEVCETEPCEDCQAKAVRT